MAMHEDDHVCYCFHVSRRKIENFCRNQKPTYPSQISECLSAGTGCGWCVPLLKKIHRQACANAKQPWWREQDEPAKTTSADEYASAEEYAAARQAYIAQKKPEPPVEGS
jgi:NAD(P)H-nitrite reductase large subunit